MLDSNDINFIKNNRAGLLQGRTVPVTLTRYTVTGVNPYTGEPVTTITTDTVQAVFKGFTGAVGGEQLIINGIAVQKGDVMVTFDDTVDLETVSFITHEGIKYVLFSIQPKGIGGTNRFECIARRAD